MQRRPNNFRLNPRSLLARDLVFAGMGQHPGTLRYYDSCAGVIHSGNHGTLTNGPTWAITARGWAVDFDGWNDHVHVPFARAVSPLKTETLSVWYLCRGANITPETQGLICIMRTGANPQASLQLDAAGTGLSANSLLDGDSAIAGPIIAALNVWHHAAGVFLAQGGDMIVQLYLDGALVATDTGTSAEYQYTAEDIHIGIQKVSLERSLNGLIGLVTHHSRALAASEISALADPSNVDLRVGSVPLILPVRRKMYFYAQAGAALEKALSDSVSISESMAKQYGMAQSNSIAISETTAKGVGKPLADSVAIAEAVAFAIGKALSDSIPVWDEYYTVTGDGSPDPNGDYYGAGVSNGQPYYKRQDGAYFLFYSSTLFVWVIADALQGLNPAWYGYPGPLGTYTQYQGTTGNPVVAAGTGLALATGKVLADSISISDVVAMAAAKILADSLAISDSAAMAVAKPLADSIAISESLANAFAKSLADTLAISDAEAKAIAKPFTDSVTISEALAKSAGKSLSDSIAISDVCTPGELVEIVREILYAVSSMLAGLKTTSTMRKGLFAASTTQKGLIAKSTIEGDK